MAASTKSLPTVNFIIPTLNAAQVLPLCLESIKKLTYPQSHITLTIVDGGSVDSTVNIAKFYGAQILENPLKTGESGKAVGIKHSQSDFVVLLDSDNFIPTPSWLNELLKPLMGHPLVVGAESWSFTHRPKSGFIERYSSLLGANDPYAYFCGIYDRYSLLSQRWTNLPVNITYDSPYYLLFGLNSPRLPTIGANGTVYRTSFLKKHFSGKYFFDTDFLPGLNLSEKPYLFAKVKNSIIHTYCESSVSKFVRKQQRRVKDFFTYESNRQHHWDDFNRYNFYLFPLYSFSLVLPLIDSVRGYLKFRDPAWFFHPLACFLTTIIYAQGYLVNLVGLHQPTNRHAWKQ